MGDTKLCTQCGEVKPLAEFAADKRSKTGRQAACRKCQKRLYKPTPHQKAIYRRRSGEVTCEYRTRDQIATDAEIRRVESAHLAKAWRVQLAAYGEARRSREALRQAGTPEWRRSATEAQIEALQCATNLKEQPRSGETCLIRLGGRFAVGPHAWAVVDVEDYWDLSSFAWKAKPNGSGSGVYAVRNVVVDGVNRTTRLHREVLGIGFHEGLDVDHIDRDPLNNSLSNLRLVTRSENLRNSDVVGRFTRQPETHYALRT